MLELKPIFKLGAIETLTFDGVGDKPLSLNQFDFAPNDKFHGSSTVPVSAAVVDSMVLAGGTETLNLTSAPGVQGPNTVDLDGLKVRFVHFVNTGSNNITIAPGASNGYEINGGDDITLYPGQPFITYFGGALVAVDSGGVRNLDITGTAADVLQLIIIGG